MPGYYGECVHTNAKRGPLVAHRVAVTAADKLATPGALTLTAVTEAGSTLPASALFVGMVSGNALGPTVAGTIPSSLTPTLHQAVNVAPATYDATATYHDFFISVDAAPKWVARATKAQLDAGGFIVSTVGAVTAGGTAPAGSIDLGIVGTGPQTTAAVYAQSNAYAVLTPAPFSCDGLSLVHLLVKMAVTDHRTAPSLSLIPFLANGESAGDWHMLPAIAFSFLGATAQALCQDKVLQVDGASGLVVLVDAIAGTGAAVSIWLEGC